MKYLEEDINELFVNDRKLYNKLKVSCYKKGIIRLLFKHYKKELFKYKAHVLLDDENNILSWIMSYDSIYLIPPTKFIMLWTPYRYRRKGYMRILLERLRKDYDNIDVHAYNDAEKVITKVYGVSHKLFFWKNTLLPHELFKSIETQMLKNKLIK